MPHNFEVCVRNGGRVRRVSGPSKDHGLGPDEYVNYCFLENESFRGEVYKKEKQSEKKED